MFLWCAGNILFPQFGFSFMGRANLDGVSCWQGRFWNLPELELVHWELVHRGIKHSLVVTVHFYGKFIYTGWELDHLCISAIYLCVCVS